jgi:hypothetical protein
MVFARFVGSRRRVALLAGGLAVAGAGAGVSLALAGSPGGRYVQQLRATVPAAKIAQVEHAQPGTAPESTVPAPVPAATIAAIPAALVPGGSAPVPVSPALVRVRNGWLVSDGRTLVAVYAGAAGDDGRNGRIVIVRQNLVAGTQSQRVLNLAGTGALTIVRAPVGAAVERSAQWASLGFRSANGRTGILDLRLGRAALAP